MKRTLLIILFVILESSLWVGVGMTASSIALIAVSANPQYISLVIGIALMIIGITVKIINNASISNHGRPLYERLKDKG